MLILLKYWQPLSKMHVTPEQRRELVEKNVRHSGIAWY